MVTTWGFQFIASTLTHTARLFGTGVKEHGLCHLLGLEQGRIGWVILGKGRFISLNQDEFDPATILRGELIWLYYSGENGRSSNFAVYVRGPYVNVTDLQMGGVTTTGAMLWPRGLSSGTMQIVAQRVSHIGPE